MQTFAEKSVAPQRILIAEDSPSQAEVLRIMLEGDGYNVEVASDGRQGLLTARAAPPDLVISDVVMPEMDGFAFCRAMRADASLKDVPFMLVTSLSGPEDVIGGLACGADNFITKPYDESVLLERVKHLLTERRHQRRHDPASGLRLELGGQVHLVIAELQQVVDMLLSAYADATRFSREAQAREDSLRQVNKTLQLLYRTAQALNQTQDENEAIAAVLACCREIASVRAVWVMLMDDSGAVRNTVAAGLPLPVNLGTGAGSRCACHAALLSGMLTEASMIGRCPLLMDNAAASPRDDRSHWAVPLIADNHRLGILAFDLDSAEAAPLGDLQLLTALGAQLAVALERALAHVRLERTVRERTAQLQVEIGERARAQDLLNDALESVAGGIAIFNAAERLVMCNSAYRLLRPAITDLLVPGIHYEVLAEASMQRQEYGPEWVATLLRNFRECDGTLERQLSDGRWVLMTNRRMVNGWTACLRIDITEIRHTQQRESALRQQVAQLQKLEAIGTLTGGLAHDFNNHIGVIVGNLGLALSRPDLDDEVKELIDESLKAAWSGADLTRRLLAFARRQPLRPARIDINELLDNSTKLLRRLIGENIQIMLQLGDGIWPVTADPAQLEAAVTNLATNARDAMPKGGRLIFSTANQHLDGTFAAEHAEVTPGDYLRISVSDTGSGMSPEVMSKIFEPFFTTKEPGKGTGLGLSMVFGFIKQSGGHVSVYSAIGMGTTFHLFLPRAREEHSIEVAPTAHKRARGTDEVVLVVEDNLRLRQTLLRQLIELGYRTLEGEASGVLDILNRQRVDLLLTDIVMPGALDGFELGRLALEQCPTLKVVLTSGFPQARFDGADKPVGSLLLLSKPYSIDELAGTLRAALDG